MKQIDYSEINKEDEHIFKLWEPLEFDINEEYEFVKNGMIFNIISNMFRIIIAPILYFMNKILFGFEIIGRENVLDIEGGRITVSNHIHPMDCTFNGLIMYPLKVYYPTLESNFKIPVVRHIIRLLNAVPIPKEVSKKMRFLEDMGQVLKKDNIVHIYPEGSLWPYYEKIRKFKKGAFKLAVDNNVPVVPIVYTFNEPEGVYFLYKRKKCIRANVLEPIYPNMTLNKPERIEDLRRRVYEKMKNYT